MSFLGRLRTTGDRSPRSRCQWSWILLPQASPLLWGLQATLGIPWVIDPSPHVYLPSYRASPVRMSVSRYPPQ